MRWRGRNEVENTCLKYGKYGIILANVNVHRGVKVE